MNEHHVPPDEHLRAALRHAPDAQLAAPPDISAQILAAAHRAAAEPATAPAAPKRRWWVFQTPQRLGASGAFATVLLAGVVGVLWHGQQPGPATEAFNEAPAPAAAPAPAPAVEPASSAVASAREPDAPLSATAPAAPAKVTAAPAQQLRQSQQQQKQARARAEESKRETGREIARMDERRSADLHKEQAAPPQARGETVVAAAPPPPAPVLAPPPAVVAAPAPAAPATAMADASPPARASRSAPAAVGGMMAKPRPTAPWMDALAAGPQVQWQVDGEARAPTSSWLYALAEQTQGRWRAAPGAQLQAGDNVVQWQRSETLLGRLWLGNERVLWCDAQGRCEEAALAADVTSALRKGLAR